MLSKAHLGNRNFLSGYTTQQEPLKTRLTADTEVEMALSSMLGCF